MTPVAPAGPDAAGPPPAAATVKAAPPSAATVRAQETAQAFEAVLIGQMTKLMMESTGEAGEFSGGHGEAMFRGVLAEQLGTEIARRGGFGLAPAVMQEIIALQNGEKP
jgi:Rod binding domain-containing protein